MTVGAVHRKVVGASPHSISTEAHVKAFLTVEDKGGICAACAMEEEFGLSLFLDLLADVLYLILEYFPQFSVLHTLNAEDNCTRLCRFEPQLLVIPLR